MLEQRDDRTGKNLNSETFAVTSSQITRHANTQCLHARCPSCHRSQQYQSIECITRQTNKHLLFSYPCKVFEGQLSNASLHSEEVDVSTELSNGIEWCIEMKQQSTNLKPRQHAITGTETNIAAIFWEEKLFLQCFDTVDWVTERHLTCKTILLQ